MPNTPFMAAAGGMPAIKSRSMQGLLKTERSESRQEGLPNFNRRESDDGYQPVVAVLGDRWRVIECRDHIQWIVQFSKASGHGKVWRGCRYVRTRTGLMAACARSVPEITPSALAILQALPERI